MDSYFGRKIAIDASMAIYQFLIAVRQAGGEGQLTNDAGEVFLPHPPVPTSIACRAAHPLLYVIAMQTRKTNIMQQ